MDGMNLLTGHTLTSTHAGVTKSFQFAFNLPNASTSKRSVLIATQAVTAYITPDYVMPDRFLATDAGTVEFAGVDSISATQSCPPTAKTRYSSPRFRDRAPISTSATNFAGRVSSVPPVPITVVEFYNRDLDHYFMSPLAPDIDALDTGHFVGWERTGLTFQATAALPSVTSASASWRGRPQSRLPLLHSTGARQLALFFGVVCRLQPDPPVDSAPIPVSAAISTKRRTLSTSHWPMWPTVPARPTHSPSTGCGTSASIPIIASRSTR